MSRKGITTLAELHELERQAIGLPHAPSARAPLSIPEPDPRAPLEIPPPLNGVAYSAAEVAVICGVTERTVRNWISAGRRARGGVVNLTALAVPRGRIAPESLCRFLSRINGISVAVREMPGVQSPVDGDGGSENALGG